MGTLLNAKRDGCVEMAALQKLRSSFQGRCRLLRSHRDATRKSGPDLNLLSLLYPHWAKPRQKPKHKSLTQSLTVSLCKLRGGQSQEESGSGGGQWKLSSTDVVKEIPVLNGTSRSFPEILWNSFLRRITESQKYLRSPCSSTQKMRISYLSNI